MTDSFVINLFINRDAISIQGKNTIYKPLSLGKYTIQGKYCDKRFLVTMGYVNQFSEHFMPSVCTYACGVMNFLMINFIRIYLSSWGLLCFISYSEHLSVIYNNKNYGSLPYILFIAVQNSRITLDRPQCIAICSKLKMALLLLKNSIYKYC